MPLGRLRTEHPKQTTTRYAGTIKVIQKNSPIQYNKVVQVLKYKERRILMANSTNSLSKINVVNAILNYCKITSTVI